MIYTGAELQAKFTHLTLVGQDDENQLIWAGENKDWAQAEVMEIKLIDGTYKNDNCGYDDYMSFNN